MASRIGGQSIPPRPAPANLAPTGSVSPTAATSSAVAAEPDAETEDWDNPVSRERSTRERSGHALDPLIDPMNPNRAFTPPGGLATIPPLAQAAQVVPVAQAAQVARANSATAPDPMAMLGIKISQLGNSLEGTRRLSMLPEACNVIVRDIGRFPGPIQHALLMTLASRLEYLVREPVADSPAQAAVMRAATGAFHGELGTALNSFKNERGTADVLKRAADYGPRAGLIEANLV